MSFTCTLMKTMMTQRTAVSSMIETILTVVVRSLKIAKNLLVMTGRILMVTGPKTVTNRSSFIDLMIEKSLRAAAGLTIKKNPMVAAEILRIMTSLMTTAIQKTVRSLNFFTVQMQKTGRNQMAATTVLMIVSY